MSEQTSREDLAVGLAEVRAGIAALNSRFDTFGDLIDAKLAPLERWMNGQQGQCALHDRKLTELEGAVRDMGPAVREHGDRLVRLEHVSANIRWVGGAAWTLLTIALGVLAKRVLGGD